MAQILLILVLGTILNNRTQDAPGQTWPWYPDLCRAVGCQGPQTLAKCGKELYDKQTHLCCGNGRDWQVTKKHSPHDDCCGFRIYNKRTMLCCEDLSIEPMQDRCLKDLGYCPSCTQDESRPLTGSRSAFGG